MKPKSLALFNVKAGVGKTTLTFHVAHMAARLGLRTLVLDFDPQSELTAMLLEGDALADWADPDRRTLVEWLDREVAGRTALRPEITQVKSDLWLLPGDLRLSKFETCDVEASLLKLKEQAIVCVPFPLPEVVLIDVGSKLGTLTRAALTCCDAIVVPLEPDIFALRSLEVMGPALQDWRMSHAPDEESRRLLGYILQLDLAHSRGAGLALDEWESRIPAEYHSRILGSKPEVPLSVEGDHECIAVFKHYASLMPLAREARKPMFDLKPADGAQGGLIRAVAECKRSFERLVREIANRLSIPVPPS